MAADKTAAKEDDPSKEEGTDDMDEENLSFEDNKDDNDRGNGPYVDEQPPKKKKKKDKKEKRKARKERRKATEQVSNESGEANEEEEIQSPPPGVRRTGRYSPRKSTFSFEKYAHKFKREHATASAILSQDEKYNELTMKVRLLMGEGLKVDPTFVIEPAQEGDKTGKWEKPSDVPFNYTDLGAAIRVAENARFEKVKPWGKRATNTDGTEVDMVDPEVYFTMCFSSDIDPEIILRRIRDEWRRQGGNRLEMKELDCFETETAVVA